MSGLEGRRETGIAEDRVEGRVDGGFRLAAVDGLVREGFAEFRFEEEDEASMGPADASSESMTSSRAVLYC